LLDERYSYWKDNWELAKAGYLYL